MRGGGLTARVLYRAGACLMGCLLAGTAPARQADTLRVEHEDAAHAPWHVVAFEGMRPGEPVGSVWPVRTGAVEPVHLLASLPGTFLYDFGTPGWPHGWSPYGMSPNEVGLEVDGLPFDDLVTGRPRYDLIPFTMLEPLRVVVPGAGRGVGVRGWVRPYAVPEPLTEIRYRTSNRGLQSVTVVHAQERRPAWFGVPARLNVVLGYGGHAARGEYPGSRLRRARQLLLRVRYARPGWALEVSDLFNRRRVGAHGGVLPVPGAPYTSIYQRLGATVEREEARRETFRNDLTATLHLRHLLPEDPLRLTGFWTRERFQYRNADDTLTARVGRLGLRLEQRLPLTQRGPWLEATLYRDRVRAGRALPDTLGLHRTRWQVSVRDTLARGGLSAAFEAGATGDEGRTYENARARLAWRAGGLLGFVEGSRAGQVVSWVARHGFGAVVQPLPEGTHPGAVTLTRGGMTLHLGPLDLTAFAFVQTLDRPVDLFVVDGDTVAARGVAGAVRWGGVALEVGLRQAAERGLYLVARPTLLRNLDQRDTPEHRRLAGSLPDVFGEARLGARFVLFQNDLDLDVAVRARYWGGMAGRELHPPTGLLVIPREGGRPVAASSTLDVYVEAGVRTATLFLAYENALSGTSLLVGNLIVPDYPLPERRFRFGVFWPIFN
ncbi:MAG: hypothetical protein KatS3mg044_1484 [Rhodothermaceae bacterium]|nr:MAG: hypothetical protein KatS3mg044_1484 [Rhodothermaceae bacterium]